MDPSTVFQVKQVLRIYREINTTIFSEDATQDDSWFQCYFSPNIESIQQSHYCKSHHCRHPLRNYTEQTVNLM